MFVMSKQVRLPKISSILHNWKIGPKSDLRPFCRKAFSYKNCNVHMNNIRIEHVVWYTNTI